MSTVWSQVCLTDPLGQRHWVDAKLRQMFPVHQMLNWDLLCLFGISHYRNKKYIYSKCFAIFFHRTSEKKNNSRALVSIIAGHSETFLPFSADFLFIVIFCSEWLDWGKKNNFRQSDSFLTFCNMNPLYEIIKTYKCFRFCLYR